MKFDGQFLNSTAGQLVVVGAVLVLGVLAVRWQHSQRQASPLPVARFNAPAALPRTFTRVGALFPQKTPPPPNQPASPKPSIASASDKPRDLPLTLFAAKAEPPAAALALPHAPIAPYGRLIPCETIVTLESNRLETPVIGLVTEDVWHDGVLVIPAGAEVHGHAALDRTRERLAAQGAWRIVWRTPGAENGTELAVQGLALDRESAPSGSWGEHDGSAGLRGEILKTSDNRELQLFAATFLSTATAALQDTRAVTGLIGEAAVPAATARNATLAGTGAVLREYAQELREAIARDGFYLYVPAGKPFYLYVTQTLDLSQATRVNAPTLSAQLHASHEN
jgi:hypothetical protein